tara:strand:- start:385 stop:909 length:525 start_codon:yes stop_codon:yes gene_type:complete
MAILNSKFDILRGWPNGSACAEELLVAAAPAAANDQLSHGSWVRMNGTNYTVVDETRADKNSVAYVDNDLKNEQLWALIIEGRDDLSAVEAGRVTVLLGGGYVVRLWNDPDAVTPDMWNDGNAADLTAGQPVTLINGLIDKTGADAGGDADLTVFGYVVAINAAAATLDVYISL